jgi:XRE family transcriptional regulator, fatty acid utilization regulator
MPSPTTTSDPLVFGQRVRHLRRARGLTLDALSARVGKPASYLSQVETGKREPRLSLVDALASALAVTRAELLSIEAPSRRSQLEIALERAQEEPLYQSLDLPYLKPSARVPDVALEHLAALYRSLSRRAEVAAQSPEGARRANAALRLEMRSADNYFPEIELVAHDALVAIGWDETRAVSERAMVDLARHFGFEIRRVRDLPRQTRSVTDLKHRVIYIPQRNAVPTRAARSVILQTLGHFALGHADPIDFADHLRQQVEVNYFAGAVLAPEGPTVEFLSDAKRRRDLSIEDLKEVFYISYEMAAHRFTNLATRHLGLAVHFVRADEEGAIQKAYENDDIPFTADHDGVIEGEHVCRRWGARTALHAEDAFDIHYQYTETPTGGYWEVTHVVADRPPYHAVSVGVREADAQFFRGRQTRRREISACPEGPCCRVPVGELRERWSGLAWPLPRQQPQVIAAPPVGAYPGVDLAEVFEFLDVRSFGDAAQ